MKRLVDVVLYIALIAVLYWYSATRIIRYFKNQWRKNSLK